MSRAARVVRALAVGPLVLGCASSKSAATDAAADGPSDVTLDVALDVVADTHLAKTDASSDGDGDGGGHCHAPDDDAMINCPSGSACSTDELGAPACVIPPEDFDAGIMPCGEIGCATSGSCFCANKVTSFCTCTTSAGPLAPPDLPVG